MSGNEFFQRRVAALSAGDVDSLVADYADDAEVVRFVGVARGPDEIRAYLVGFLAAHRRFDLISLDQFRETDESVMWEATVETAAGPLQVYEVLVFNDEGKIWREFPGSQGYWGSF